MSQNKTVIPGFEPADNSNDRVNPNFYSRGGVHQSAKGTVVSGMSNGESVNHSSKTTGFDRSYMIKGRALQSEKPIIGFLYSVSRTAAGEFWPLQIGQNTIGKSPDCDVVLPEGTVSSEHAVLVIRKMKNPEKIIASISDARSTNGTMLNGVSLGFSAEECKNGDIITIGDNYELCLILVDSASMGLSVSKDFIPVDDPIYEEQAKPSGYTRPNAQSSGTAGYKPTDGTQGFDPDSSNNKGGTIAM